jgi:hypothetical protein
MHRVGSKKTLGEFVRVAPRNHFPGAPTDPDVRISRIRFLGPRVRYVT